jgi:hypothetical protein
MLNDDYHGTSAIGSSGIKRLLKSPAIYKYECDNPPAPTKAMEIGTYTHAGVLEPDLFNDTWFRLPEGDRRKKEYKEAIAELALDHPGKSGIDPVTWDRIEGMKASILANPQARRLLQPKSKVLIEGSYFWDWDGIECKCRPDFFCPEENYVVDLKTTIDATPAGFARSCANFGYHIQEAFYRTGLRAHGHEVERFIFLAVEKEPPYLVGIYTLSSQALHHGYYQVTEALDSYSECKAINHWHGLSEEILELELPRWAVPQDPEKADKGESLIKSVNSVRFAAGSMLTMDEACELAGVSRVTLYKWMGTGLHWQPANPNVKRSRRLIKASTLQHYIDARQKAS